MNSDFSLFAEHVVKKRQGRYTHIFKPLAFGLDILLSLLLGLVLSSFMGLTVGFASTVIIGAFGLGLHARLFRTVEYDYRITDGELYFSEVYNRRKRQERFVLSLAKFEMLAPYREPYKTTADRMTFDAVHDFSSSPETPDLYFGIYVDEERSMRLLFLFEPSPKILRLLSFYNRRTVVIKLSSEESDL